MFLNNAAGWDHRMVAPSKAGIPGRTVPIYKPLAMITFLWLSAGKLTKMEIEREMDHRNLGFAVLVFMWIWSTWTMVNINDHLTISPRSAPHRQGQSGGMHSASVPALTEFSIPV